MKRERRKGPNSPRRHRKRFSGRPGKNAYVSRRIPNSPAAQVMGMEGGPKAIGELFDYHKQWYTDRTQSVCEYPLQMGTCGSPDVIDGHTISESILHRVGERPPDSQEVKVLSLCLDIASLTKRITKLDTKLSQAFYNERRWTPEPIGIGSASVRFFSCRLHDQEWFKPIERDAGAGLRHPLDTHPLTHEQYFHLANRVVLFSVAELRRTYRVLSQVQTRPSSTPIPSDFLEESQNSIRDHSNRLKSSLDTFHRAKGDFEVGYRNQDFTSLIDTPIDRVLQLPIRVAAADIYSVRGRDLQGSVFLTVFPCGTSPAQNQLYDHRVIVSHLKAYATEVRPTVDAIDQLHEDVGRFRGKRQKLVGEFISRTRNAYFSYDYERKLTADDRKYIEKLAYKDTLDSLPPWFKRDLLGMS